MHSANEWCAGTIPRISNIPAWFVLKEISANFGFVPLSIDTPLKEKTWDKDIHQCSVINKSSMNQSHAIQK